MDDRCRSGPATYAEKRSSNDYLKERQKRARHFVSNVNAVMPMDLHAAVNRIDLLLSGILKHSGFLLTYVIQTTERTAEVQVNFAGADVPLLLAHRAELLLALEHLAVKTVGLNPEDHDQVSFDAGGFKSERDHRIEGAARRAIKHVQEFGVAFHFPPMNSRERRLLHLALASLGLVAASEGEEPLRHLVLHPPASQN